MCEAIRQEFTVAFGLYDLLPNTALIERTHQHLSAVGVPAWSDDEQAFARECQENFGAPALGMVPHVMPIIPDRTEGGSSDVGDVSWNTPTIFFLYPSFPLGVGLHTWPVTACGGMSIGTKAALGAAEVHVRLGYDLLTDGDLRAAARADFDARRAGKTYVSPLDSVDTSSAATEEAAHQPKDGADDLAEVETRSAG